MKKFVSLLLCAVVLFSCFVFQTSAVNEDELVPYVIDFSLTPPASNESELNESRASDLILSYGLEISASDSKIKILAQTTCVASVVKSGFKNLVVQRKKVSSSTWADYFDIGDIYDDTYAARINMTVAVATGYQYRVTCKHYAKKSLLVTQSISNTSNVVSV